jgi:hypothetical protein
VKSGPATSPSIPLAPEDEESMARFDNPVAAIGKTGSVHAYGFRFRGRRPLRWRAFSTSRSDC